MYMLLISIPCFLLFYCIWYTCHAGEGNRGVQTSTGMETLLVASGAFHNGGDVVFLPGIYSVNLAHVRYRYVYVYDSVLCMLQHA